VINKEGRNILSKEIQEILFGEGKKKADISLVWSLGLEDQAANDKKPKKKMAFELLSGILRIKGKIFIKFIIGTTGYKHGANIKKGVSPSIFSKVSKYWMYENFKRLLGEIEKKKNEGDGSEIVKVLCMKKEEMERNLDKPMKGKLPKKRYYKAYKWISFRYSMVKKLIKLAFGEWTVVKRKGEVFA